VTESPKKSWRERLAERIAEKKDRDEIFEVGLEKLGVHIKRSRDKQEKVLAIAETKLNINSAIDYQKQPEDRLKSLRDKLNEVDVAVNTQAYPDLSAMDRENSYAGAFVEGWEGLNSLSVDLLMSSERIIRTAQKGDLASAADFSEIEAALSKLNDPDLTNKLEHFKQQFAQARKAVRLLNLDEIPFLTESWLRVETFPLAFMVIGKSHGRKPDMVAVIKSEEPYRLQSSRVHFGDEGPKGGD
jgi:hypothetical protein